MRSGLITVAAALGAVSLAVLVGFGVVDLATTLLVLVLLAVVLPICHAATTDLDPWLWWVAPLAFIVKLVGSGVRYFALEFIYGGVGDAGQYHRWGTQLADAWRTGIIPGLDGSMGEGTQVVRWITGLLFVPHKPSLLGGFFMFATLAFLGQLLFYVAFRRALPGGRLGIYGFLIFFLPVMVFWPSSIGKESLMIFFLGLATYAMARASTDFSPLWLVLAGAGLFGAGMIRPHMAALLTVAFALAALFGKASWSARTTVRRLALLGIGVLLAVASIGNFADRFDLEQTEDIDPFVSEIESQTQQGGSSVEGENAFSLAALPAASLRVLFRPLPYEAHNLQALANAVENTALLALVLWKTPAMLRRIRSIRIPYVLMGAAFTVGFIIAFSTVFNLGILARQRSQAIPYMLAVVVALGWDLVPTLDPNRGQHLAEAS
jgi:hypothetical protein